MRSDHLAKHIKRCQNRESAAARVASSTITADATNSDQTVESNQCTAMDCTYSASCLQCQNDQKMNRSTVNDDANFSGFILPATPLPRNIPSPTSFSCPASMFYNHFNNLTAANRLPPQTNLPISTCTTSNLIASFAINNPFSVFNQNETNQKLNNHSIDSIIFTPHFKSTFQPSCIVNEDSNSCSSLPPQLYFP